MQSKNVSRIIWGSLLVIAGVAFALNALEITQIDLFFSGWWTLFIIIPSVVGLINKRDKLGSIIGLTIGVILLLAAQDILPFGTIWKLLIPLVIVLIGLRMIFGSPSQRAVNVEIKHVQVDPRGLPHETATFSENSVNYGGRIFTGASLDAVFGSIHCDLRNAIIENDCVIKASVVFAGIDIRLPDFVDVKISSNALFGGVSNKRNINRPEGDAFEQRVTVYIDATCVFGGVDIQ
jgi:predicted membrane protein